MFRISMLIAGLFSLAAAQATAQPAKAWKLAWSDEFEGEAIDRKKWDFDLGNGFYNYEAKIWIGGWGNNELQHYTREPENAFVKDGNLHIRVIKESYMGQGYTSARMKTKKRDGSILFATLYGKVEFRAKLPVGKGVWPALWMLPADEKYGGWASSGEIDVMEARGQEPNKVLGTLHYGSRWPNNTHKGKDYLFPNNGTIADWHTYTVEWEPGEIRWSVDGNHYQTQNHWWSSSKVEGGKGARPAAAGDVNTWPAPFDQRFFLIMNVAVGGNFLGPPDANTEFPVEMLVDYVRVYEKPGGYGPTKARGEGKLPFEGK